MQFYLTAIAHGYYRNVYCTIPVKMTNINDAPVFHASSVFTVAERTSKYSSVGK
jgi:hypothetical protein